MIPVVTSAVVGVFTACTTRSPSSSTASVLVPPTSIPMRFTAENTERKSRSYPKARGPTCSSPFGVSRISGAGSAITLTRWP